jgi:hypothetical protein
MVVQRHLGGEGIELVLVVAGDADLLCVDLRSLTQEIDGRYRSPLS